MNETLLTPALPTPGSSKISTIIMILGGVSLVSLTCASIYFYVALAKLTQTLGNMETSLAQSDAKLQQLSSDLASTIEQLEANQQRTIELLSQSTDTRLQELSKELKTVSETTEVISEKQNQEKLAIQQVSPGSFSRSTAEKKLTITGTGFSKDMTVDLVDGDNMNYLVQIEFVNGHEIKATLPAELKPGYYGLRVGNKNGEFFETKSSVLITG